MIHFLQQAYVFLLSYHNITTPKIYLVTPWKAPYLQIGNHTHESIMGNAVPKLWTHHPQTQTSEKKKIHKNRHFLYFSLSIHIFTGPSQIIISSQQSSYILCHLTLHWSFRTELIYATAEASLFPVTGLPKKLVGFWGASLSQCDICIAHRSSTPACVKPCVACFA